MLLLSISFATFTKVFYTLAALIGLGIIFEKKIIALEDRFDKWWERKKAKGVYLNDTRKS